jgi:hypothetical protein
VDSTQREITVQGDSIIVAFADEQLSDIPSYASTAKRRFGLFLLE